MRPRSPFGTVLASRGAVYLLLTALIGRLPTAMAALAIVQLVRLQGGDFALAGVMTSAYVVAGAVGAPLLGRWVDRMGQTRVLGVSALLATAGFVGMALGSAAAPPAAVAFAALAGLATPPLEPSLRSLWPGMVPPGAPLKAAFSLDAGAQELVFIAGPLLTVLGVGAFGATGNVVFAAALGLVGAAAFALHPRSRGARVFAADVSRARSPMRNGVLRRVVLFQFGIGLPIGVLTILATSLGELRDIVGFAGWALAANAGGALVGATVSALRPSRRRPESLLAPFGLALAIAYLPLSAVGLPVPLLLVLAFVAGLMLPPTLGQVFDLVHRTSAERSLTEANAWVVSAFNVGIAAGTTGSGVLLELGGIAALPGIVVGASVLTAAFCLVVLRLPASAPLGEPMGR